MSDISTPAESGVFLIAPRTPLYPRPGIALGEGVELAAAGDQVEDLVLISRADYEDLVRLRAEESARRPPAEVAAMIARGDTPLRAWRKHRRLSQAQLAAAAGMTQGYLSELERGGDKTPSRVTLKFLALALGVSIAAIA